MLAEIPAEVLEYLMSFLPTVVLCKISQTSVRMCRFIEQLPRWRTIVLKDIMPFEASMRSHVAAVMPCVRAQIMAVCLASLDGVDGISRDPRWSLLMGGGGGGDNTNTCVAFENIIAQDPPTQYAMFVAIAEKSPRMQANIVARCTNASHNDMSKLRGLPWNGVAWPKGQPTRDGGAPFCGPRKSFKLLVDARETYDRAFRVSHKRTAESIIWIIEKTQVAINLSASTEDALHGKLREMLTRKIEERDRMRRKMHFTQSCLQVFSYVLSAQQMAVVCNASKCLRSVPWSLQ
jgi:hypothetical protein